MNDQSQAEIRLPSGQLVRIDIAHLDELIRRGSRDVQGSILYWEGEGNNRKAADAMRRIRDDGGRLRNFLLGEQKEVDHD